MCALNNRDLCIAHTLLREERESPEVWSHICIQKLAELAKESTTMRRVLEPMLLYFDTRRQWAPRRGLALLVLSDMCYLEKTSGNTAHLFTLKFFCLTELCT